MDHFSARTNMDKGVIDLREKIEKKNPGGDGSRKNAAAD